jgi:hypothetical protein
MNNSQPYRAAQPRYQEFREGDRTFHQDLHFKDKNRAIHLNHQNPNLYPTQQPPQSKGNFAPNRILLKPRESTTNVSFDDNTKADEEVYCQPCFTFLTKYSCSRKNCPYSHDKAVAKAFLEEALAASQAQSDNFSALSMPMKTAPSLNAIAANSRPSVFISDFDKAIERSKFYTTTEEYNNRTVRHPGERDLPSISTIATLDNETYHENLLFESFCDLSNVLKFYFKDILLQTGHFDSFFSKYLKSFPPIPVTPLPTCLINDNEIPPDLTEKFVRLAVICNQNSFDHLRSNIFKDIAANYFFIQDNKKLYFRSPSLFMYKKPISSISSCNDAVNSLTTAVDSISSLTPPILDNILLNEIENIYDVMLKVKELQDNSNGNEPLPYIRTCGDYVSALSPAASLNIDLSGDVSDADVPTDLEDNSDNEDLPENLHLSVRHKPFLSSPANVLNLSKNPDPSSYPFM